MLLRTYGLSQPMDFCVICFWLRVFRAHDVSVTLLPLNSLGLPSGAISRRVAPFGAMFG